MKATSNAHFLKMCVLAGRSTAVDSGKELLLVFMVLREWVMGDQLQTGA
jgi:hypothetical protein